MSKNMQSMQDMKGLQDLRVRTDRVNQDCAETLKKLDWKSDDKIRDPMLNSLKALVAEWDHYLKNPSELEKEPLELGVLLRHSLSGVYFELGDFDSARKLLEQFLAFKQARYGLKDPGLIGVLIELQTIYDKTNDKKKSQEILEWVLKIEEGQPEKDKIDSQGTLLVLANSCHKLGDEQNSQKFLKRVLQIQELTHEKDSPETTEILVKLGKSHDRLGEKKLAQEYLNRALQAQERAYGKDHHLVGDTLVTLGNCLKDEDVQQSQACFKRALTIAENDLKRHEQASSEVPYFSFFNVGTLYRRFNNPKGALPFLERALEGCEKSPGKDSVKNLHILMELALANRDLQKWEAGISFAERAYQVALKVYGANHADAREANACIRLWKIEKTAQEVNKINRIALNLYKANKFGQAAQAYERILTHPNFEVLAPDVRALSHYNLSHAYRGAQQFLKAKEHCRKCLEIRRQNPVPNDMLAMKAENGLKALDIDLKKKADAEFLKELNELGIEYFKKQDYKKAIENFVPLLDSCLGTELEMANLHLNLAICYDKTANKQKAEYHVKQYMDIISKKRPEGVQRVQNSFEFGFEQPVPIKLLLSSEGTILDYQIQLEQKGAAPAAAAPNSSKKPVEAAKTKK